MENIKYLISLYKGPDKALLVALTIAVVFLSSGWTLSNISNEKRIQTLEKEKFQSDHDCQLEQIKYLREIIIKQDNRQNEWDSTVVEVKRALKIDKVHP